MHPSENRILNRARSLRRRAAIAAFLGTWLRHLGVGMVSLSVAIILARVAFGLPLQDVVPLLVFLALTPISAGWMAKRRIPSLEATTAWLDQRVGATGLVLTQAVHDDARWRESSERLIDSRKDSPSFAWTLILRPIALPVLFMLVSFVIPVPDRAVANPSTIASPMIEELREKFATLEESFTLEEDTKEEIEERLETLDQEGADAPLESTFEALDALDSRLADEAQGLQRSLEQAYRSLSDLADASNGDASGGDGSQPENHELAQGLEAIMERLALEGLDKDLQATLAELTSLELSENILSKLGLNAEQLRELANALQKHLEGKWSDLIDAGLLQGEGLPSLSELGIASQPFKPHVCDENCKKDGEGGG